mmetsp:Transcript_38074/g.50166  ORF Transcript_38074/g.50166 Transcript_38074/m.50166 type:complete len:317 (+) Transcript_38074:43-993(+)
MMPQFELKWCNLPQKVLVAKFSMLLLALLLILQLFCENCSSFRTGFSHDFRANLRRLPHGDFQYYQKRHSNTDAQCNHSHRKIILMDMNPSNSSKGKKGATKVQEMISSGAFLQTTALMTLAGGALGPWLDGQHGAFGVLNYHQPFNIIAGEMTILKTALWVPPLFGVAGFLIGGLYPLLDYIFSTDNQKMKPSMPKVLYGISFFAAQYYLSGLLTFAGADLLDIHIILAILAAIGFMAFDFSLAGFLISFLTAIGGPLIEIALINQFGLYDYTHADFYGIDSWIPWVYFMGGPAVGNLSRIVFQNRVAALHSKSK